MSDVLFERRDGVGLVTLNRPESMNAMGGDLIPMLGDILTQCERDRAVRCVALTGAGRGFCAGGDVKGMVAGQQSSDGTGNGERPSVAVSLEETVRGLRISQNRTSLKLHTMAKPTVALVNGAAAGAGMSLALSTDLRIFSDKGRLVPAFAKVGLSGDFGASYFLQKLIGRGRALHHFWTGEQIDAQLASELGIANVVVPHEELLDRGLEYCARLAKGPTLVYARQKENFNVAAADGLEAALDTEALNMRLSGMSKDVREGTRAFVEKREPQFAGE